MTWSKPPQGDDHETVHVTYPDGRTDDMPSGAALLLLATRIFYRLGTTDSEEGNTVSAAINAARERVNRVLNGEQIDFDGIKLTMPGADA